jgi:carboxypeptidase Q
MRTNLGLSNLCIFSLLQIIAISSVSADTLSDNTLKLREEISVHGEDYKNLKELTQLGHRMTGTLGAENAIQWAKKKMEAYGLSHVRLQPVMVPVWVRVETKKATLSTPAEPIDLKITALGNSVGTDKSGLEAEVIEVKSFTDLDRLRDQVRGKIVFYNHAMDAPPKNQFEAYENAVAYRSRGASLAAKYGAVAALIRSITPLLDDDHPHTGTMRYNPNFPKIPTAALSTHAANTLSDSLKKKSSLRVKLQLNCHGMDKLVQSYNVIGEITGESRPNEYVVLGGHIDSWDLGVGAHDDGAGIVHSLEVMRAFKALNLHPKRTIRIVLFIDEEKSASGAEEFASKVQDDQERVVLALESDLGGHAPKGFSYLAPDNSVQLEDGTIAHKLGSWKKYLEPFKATDIVSGECGVDVEPLVSNGTIGIGFLPHMDKYFNLHHSALDQLETVNPAELNMGSAAIATVIYLASETLSFK